MAAVLASTFAYFTSFHLLLTAFPLYVVTLDGSEQIVGVLVGLFAFGAVMFRLYFGTAADLRGRKGVLAISIAASTVGPLLYIIPLGLVYLGFARILHAVGAAAFIVASQTLLADFASERSRGKAFGLYAAASGIPMTFAPYLGQRIAELWGYPWLFGTAAICGLLMIPGYFLVDEQRPVSVGKPPSTWRAVQDSFAAARSNRWVWVSGIVLLSATVVLGALQSFLPLHATRIGLSDIGLYYTGFAVAFISSGLLAGPLSDKTGRRLVAGPALLLMAVGLVLLAGLRSQAGLVSAGILIGTGFGSANTALLALAAGKTDYRQRAKAVSFLNNNFDLGIALGSMTLGSLAARSFSFLWLTNAALLAAGFFVLLLTLPSDEEDMP